MLETGTPHSQFPGLSDLSGGGKKTDCFLIHGTDS